VSPQHGSYAFGATLGDGTTYGEIYLKQNIDYNIRLSRDHSYTFGIWAKAAEGVSGTCTLTTSLSVLVSSATFTETITNNQPFLSDYTYYSGQGHFQAADAGSPYVEIIIYCEEPNVATVYLDNAVLEFYAST
jgi:hypothetical protein